MREETSESTLLLQQPRIPREEKMARERAAVADADEVRYSERAFVPQHPASLDEVRAAVDALVLKRVEIPEPAPVPPEPEPPATGALPADVVEALRAVVPGELVAARARYVTADGEVVEATSSGPGGATSTALYVVRDGVARALDSIESQVDALPDPTPPPGASPAPAAALPVPATPPPVEETPVVADAPSPAASVAPAEEPAKKGFASRFKRGKDKPAGPASAPAPTPAPVPVAEEKAAPAPEAPKKGGLASRFKLGKDKDAAPAEAAPASEPAEGTSAPAEKKRFGLRRK